MGFATALKRLIRSRELNGTEIWRRFASVLVADPIVNLEEYQGQFAVGPRSHILRQIICSGHYERSSAEWFRLHIDPTLDVIDVGANVGFYTVMAARCVSTGRVWAVEPVDAALRRLTANINRNAVSRKVTVFAGVASSFTGKVTINVIPDLEEYSSLGRLSHPSVAGMHSEPSEVAAITIDDLVRMDGINPGIMKIDVEGAEEAVLTGASQVLSTSRPIILMEVSGGLLQQNNSSVSAVLSKLSDYDYAVFDIEYPQLRIGFRMTSNVACIPRETSNLVDLN